MSAAFPPVGTYQLALGIFDSLSNAKVPNETESRYVWYFRVLWGEIHCPFSRNGTLIDWNGQPSKILTEFANECPNPDGFFGSVGLGATLGLST